MKLQTIDTGLADLTQYVAEVESKKEHLIPDKWYEDLIAIILREKAHVCGNWFEPTRQTASAIQQIAHTTESGFGNLRFAAG